MPGRVLRAVATAASLIVLAGTAAAPAYAESAASRAIAKPAAISAVSATATAKPKPPKLTRVAPSKGVYTGGQKLTLAGSNLKQVTRVRVGTANAKILTRSSTKLTVRTPIGVLGKTSIRAYNKGGSSTSLAFTYVTPARKKSVVVTKVAGTFQPAAVDWVTGGYDDDTAKLHPWLVGLPQGSAVPAVGQRFLVAPGTAAFPTGLVGTVKTVSVQVDESVRVTVAPADLQTALQRVSIAYSGPLGAEVGADGVHAQAVDTDTAVEFPISGSSLFCHDQHGRSVAVGADASLEVTDVDTSSRLDAGSFIRKPSWDGSITAEVRLTGKFHAAAASTCSVSPAWQNAHRKVFLLANGATISFAPEIEFSVSAEGTLTVTNRTRMTIAIHDTFGSVPTSTVTSRSVETKFGGDVTLSAELAAGPEIRFGELDRVGVSGDVLVAAGVDLKLGGGNICATGKIKLKLSLDLFFDLWVKKWKANAISTSFDLLELARTCLRPDDAPPSTQEPVITSGRLPGATIDTPYSATLHTADNRNGTWSADSGLPAGLTLAAGTGVISGTPTGPVGDRTITVSFKDGDGRVGTTIIRILVQPATGIGGGDIQVQLRWTGPADLDLHVTDPAGEEIYYNEPTSDSGGQLDHDANAACNGPADDDNAVENIFWPTGGAPAGAYNAWVHVFAECDGPLDWHLTVRRNGRVVVDETGTGESPQFPFTVGTA